MARQQGVNWKERGLGPVDDDTFKAEFGRRLTPETARGLGGNVILYLARKGGKKHAYEARFTRVGSDHHGGTAASFVLFVGASDREGRRFTFEEDGRLSEPVDVVSESQKQTREIGGYAQRKARPSPEKSA